MILSTPGATVKKHYLYRYVDEDDLLYFKSQMDALLASLSDNDEQCNQDKLKSFLNGTFFDPEHYDVQSMGSIDMVIAEHGAAHPAVLFELKAPCNHEMIATDDLNRKAFHELVLYYVREECVNHNTDVAQLVITNGQEWFFFDHQQFYKLFVANGKFAKSILKAEEQGNSTDYIYKQIIKPYVATVAERVKATYFDLRLLRDKPATDRKVKAVYKLLSPTHLFSLPVDTDYNELNEEFYNELLYLMGVREVTENGLVKIKRMDKGRQHYSLLEQALYYLEEYKVAESETYEVALGLVITWVNRLLFLKLLEALLMGFHADDESHKFMDYRRIANYGTLNELFLKAFAKPEEERIAELNERFHELPYLNSSLFEMSPLEKEFFCVSGIKDGDVEVYSKTILRDGSGKKLTGRIKQFEYIFRFLDCYDFGSVKGDNKANDTRPLINAAVLGLIFEKINGYKEGSFFTPGYIAEYICHDTLRQTIVDKVNEQFFGGDCCCPNYDSLIDWIDDKEKRVKVNEIINSLKVCDPSVGSGHFLVSALNEIIAIKRELKVLFTREDKPRLFTLYKIRVEDDELIVYNEDGEIFAYNPSDPESQIIQKMLFEEKRTIIENCLFGADINLKSVDICCLRLWIELLKNAYYDKKADGKRRLQTLPNIDINIKAGNSLVSRYRYEAKRFYFAIIHNSDGQQLREMIAEYRELVAEYKNVRDKHVKHHVNERLREIKEKFCREGESIDLFDTNVETDLQSNAIFRHSVEWAFEFPEIIRDNGEFIGFDIVFGNPPYGVSIKDDYRKFIKRRWGHLPDFEIYYYFIQLAGCLLRKGGRLGYIVPNTWLFNVNADKYREELLERWRIVEVLDCSRFKFFKKAGVNNSIISFINEHTDDQLIGYRPTAEPLSFKEFTKQDKMFIAKDRLLAMNHNWALAFRNSPETNALVEKIAFGKAKVKDFFNVTQGYIPYRLRDLVKKYGEEKGSQIKNQRLWHSSHKSDEFTIQEIYGRDISKLSYKAAGEYVKYGKHVGTYVSMEYFSGKRLLVREITNPGIIACIVDETFVNDPQILPVKYKEDNQYFSYELLWAILNSRLATFYHFNHSPKATKGMFPKIMVKDLKEFPLPDVDEYAKQRIETLVKKVHEEKAQGKDTAETEWDIDKEIARLYDVELEDVTIYRPLSQPNEQEDPRLFHLNQE